MLAVVALVAAFAAGCGTGAGAESAPTPTALPDDGTTFSNPIADLGNDPYVIAHEDGYLFVEARSNGELWVTTSDPHNLTDALWSGQRTKVWQPPAVGANCRDVWAPELHPIGDRWYLYYAATTCDGDNANHRMFVLESEGSDPLGPYIDRGQITDDTDRWAIDGTVLETGGQLYFVWSGWEGTQDGQQNLYAATMSDPVTISGPRVQISAPTEPWETREMPIQEGPQVLRHPEALHLVYSTSASWTDDYAYGLLTLTGDDVLDPASWSKSVEAVFSQTGSVRGPGHGSFVASPDGTEDWMVYHATRTVGWDRMVFAQRFTWLPDGTPDFGEPVAAGVPQEVPSGQVPPARE